MRKLSLTSICCGQGYFSLSGATPVSFANVGQKEAEVGRAEGRMVEGKCTVAKVVSTLGCSPWI